jgi:choline dehydrogenase-like flavoprotein
MAPRSLGGKELPLTLFVNSDHLSGVVDPRMKIYGLTNVRVVDASVIPLTTGVAIQSTVYAIAEKVSSKLAWVT